MAAAPTTEDTQRTLCSPQPTRRRRTHTRSLSCHTTQGVFLPRRRDTFVDRYVSRPPFRVSHRLDSNLRCRKSSNKLIVVMIGIFAIAVLAVQATVVLTGARYPSGLNPALCPNYPHCDNALLAAYAQPDSHYAAGRYHNDDDGQYDPSSAGYQRHPAAYNHHGHHAPSAVGAVPYTEPGYPAGLTSSNCPNYPYCSHQVPAEAFRYAQDRRYPSGVSAHNCPNYPYCH